MTYWEKELEKIEEGLKKYSEKTHFDLDSYDFGKYVGMKNQILKDQEEHKKKMEELKEKLKKEIDSDKIIEDFMISKKEMFSIIDKLFTEVGK